MPLRISILFVILAVSLKTMAQDVVELKIPRSNKVVIKFMFRNGSITDPAGKEGLTQLVTDVITAGGTKDLTLQQINDTIYPWAAAYGGSTDKEVSTFTFQVPAVFLSKFYPIVKGLILTPSFAQKDFDRVKSNQQNYVDEVIRTSSDEEYSKKALEDMLFRGMPYQHLVAGTTDGIKAITLDDVKEHYRKYFTRNNVMIGIAGDYPASFVNQLKSDLQQLPLLQSPIPTPAIAPMPKGVNVEIIAKDNALGSAIFGGFPINITRANDDFAALMVANSWLGEHRKEYSRLYQKLREARSMNYGDYTYIEWYQNGGGNMLPATGVPRSSNYFSFWIRPVQTAKGLKGQYPELNDISIGHAHFAIRMVVSEINKLITNGMTQENFDLTRDFLRSYIKLYIQGTEKQLGFLMDSRFYGRKDYITELDALLARLTLADVNNAIKKYLQTENMDIVIVTDKSEAEPLANSLRENLPSPMSYANTLKSALPANIFEEDKQVENYRLNINDIKIINSNDTFRNANK